MQQSLIQGSLKREKLNTQELLDPQDEMICRCIDALRQDLPSIFARKEVPRLTGNAIAAGTLSNIHSQGYGPPCVRNGRNSIYEKQTFLAWYSLYLRGGIKAVKNAYGSK